ncbi:hypothetical protein SEA_GUUELAD_129 [Mycobacterium phage GuuelaD]|uniref:Helix-turn-helix DNA binding domain protein n=1 Tax=Mycobacterium phage GuuelaD TaxID=2015819 RepID=A0A286MQM7_9CAUD|nr:hypothetical protein J4T97_gp112 [Mycobacterium phage GuuelaD]ALY07441.1 hypothetical protein SEA_MKALIMITINIS3_133 [Mycobacterium phage MkaliMitinis3]ASW31552.1 hypothetical protein SEA_GUUELAD_129 [Mycobacterium phage GuuelaD]
MESVYSPSMVSDATLISIASRTEAIIAETVALYDAIREAKENGYSYNELEQATKFTRGTLQNIAAGKNPRLSIEERC